MSVKQNEPERHKKRSALCSVRNANTLENATDKRIYGADVSVQPRGQTQRRLPANEQTNNIRIAIPLSLIAHLLIKQ